MQLFIIIHIVMKLILYLPSKGLIQSHSRKTKMDIVNF